MYIGLLSIKRILTEFRPQIKSLLLTLLVTSYYARQIKSSPPSTGSQKVSPGPFRRSGVACVRVYFWKRSGAVFSKKVATLRPTHGGGGHFNAPLLFVKDDCSVWASSRPAQGLTKLPTGRSSSSPNGNDFRLFLLLD